MLQTKFTFFILFLLMFSYFKFSILLFSCLKFKLFNGFLLMSNAFIGQFRSIIWTKALSSRPAHDIAKFSMFFQLASTNFSCLNNKQLLADSAYKMINLFGKLEGKANQHGLMIFVSFSKKMQWIRLNYWRQGQFPWIKVLKFYKAS